MSDGPPENDEVDSYRICRSCLTDVYIHHHIEATGEELQCKYCSKVTKTISLEELASRIEDAVEQHYYLVCDESDDGYPVIDLLVKLLGVSEEIAGDLRSVLEDRNWTQDDALEGSPMPFDEDSYYDDLPLEIGDTYHNWSEFEYSLREEARLFNNSAVIMLDNVFRGLNEHQTRKGDSVIRYAGPGTAMPHFYRARYFERPEDVRAALARPDRRLGPPPPELAAGGRMNAFGISVFYGAVAAKTSLAEIRPPVGSDALVARFDVLRLLKLLDIEALRSVYAHGSKLDPAYLELAKSASFLAYISRLMSIPVLPKQQEMGYVITQAIAEYLANRPGLDIDGLLYPSVQEGEHGTNVVLFHKSARMEFLSDDITISATFDENLGPDDGKPTYSVTEKDNSGPKRRQAKYGASSALDYREYRDKRPMSLRIDRFSICYHEIKGVQVSSEFYPVTWLRMPKMPE
jgi:hypothetical protein